ncbi:MAG: 4Fe-4S binding protein [Acidobacteria bacterium]|nr:4Fe-4S binding protein [Acidobacteriota bacterium]
MTRRAGLDRPSSPDGSAGRPTELLGVRSVLRRSLPALLLACAAAFPVGATSTEPVAGSSFASAVQPAGETLADDFWDFEDEEEDETWGMLLRDQAPDLVLFAAFATLALVSFHRKSVPLKYVTLVAAVAYLGFYKSQLISVVNLYSAATGNLPVFRYSLAWYLFAGFTVVTTILWGRLYCGRVCAYGALTQLLDRVVPARLRIEVPPWLEHRAARIKYFLLGATLLYFFASSDIAAYRYVEPFWMFTLRSTPALWVGLAALLVATVFVRNLYCRFLCPVGAALGLLSKLTVFRIKRWSECNSCKICEKACEWGAIQGPRIDMTECVRCDDCERLYADTVKCPHWIILRRTGA